MITIGKLSLQSASKTSAIHPGLRIAPLLFCLITGMLGPPTALGNSLTISHPASVHPQAEPVSQAPRPAIKPTVQPKRLLTRVVEVRQLSPAQASRAIPVRIQGVVTAFSGWKNSFFLKDTTAGISVDRTDSARVKTGELVEVIGTSAPGLFAPTLLAAQVRVLGQAASPHPRRVTYGDMYGGAQDSQWIEVLGIVHSARQSEVFGHAVLQLHVELGGGSMEVFLQDFAGLDPAGLVDATLRIRGVCATVFNEKRQFVGLSLFVPSRADVDTVQPADQQPFTMPLTPIPNILQFGQGRHRVKVTGTVTYQIPGEAAYLQNGDNGVEVHSLSKQTLPVGASVEAVGFAVRGDYSPMIEDGLFRVLGPAEPVVPLTVAADQVITQQQGFFQIPSSLRLVRLQGEVIERQLSRGQRIWLLHQGSVVFEVHQPISPGDKRLKDMGAGSVISVIGVCIIHTDSEHNPIFFSILARSPKEIVVLSQSPWWTPARRLSLLASLAGIVILVLLWVVLLRQRVEKQTRIIRESEGRFRYLAEHDGLTGLWNRVAILAALDREMERSRRQGATLIVALADIDHFKQINDVHGHLAGDEALRRFALAITASLRVYDSVGRYGGEEFLLILPGIKPMGIETRLAELHRSLSHLTVAGQHTVFQVNCCLGAALVTQDDPAVDARLALAAADQALYEAKECGRNQVVLHRMTTAHLQNGIR